MCLNPLLLDENQPTKAVLAADFPGTTNTMRNDPPVPIVEGLDQDRRSGLRHFADLAGKFSAAHLGGGYLRVTDERHTNVSRKRK